MSTDEQPKRGLFGRKKTPKANKRPNRFKQMWDVFQMTRRHKPISVLWMALVFVGAILLGLVVGVLIGYPVLTAITGGMVGVLLAMILLGRFAETAAFEQIEGQPGAIGAALNSARRSWLMEDQPVAVDARHRDVVYRSTGRGGVVLVSEGPSSRVSKLLGKEQKRTERVVPGVPVHVIQGGNGEGQVPLKRVPREVNRIKQTLRKEEVLAVRRRLAALGNTSLPIPKGIDPARARPDRKALRGR